ncbi:phosphotransferase enzyme [Aspergillus tubingensis]|nr:phosphotransferase enzyme [Aspergillus tubingensis]
MATTVPIPYFAPDIIPCPLPTTSEIDAAPDISLEYGGRRIVEIGDHLVVKFGNAVDLIEGENMLFVQENTSIRVPRVYALYSDPSTGKNYIVMEKIPGQTLLSLWPQLIPSEKETIVTTIHDYFNELRRLPPPDYYGSLGRRCFLDEIFWTYDPEPSINGPFTSENALIEAMARKYTYDGRPPYRADFYRQCLPRLLRSHGPTFTHGDFQRKNIQIQRVVNNSDGQDTSHLQVTVLDWKRRVGIQATGSIVLLSARCDGMMTGVFGLRRCWILVSLNRRGFKRFGWSYGLRAFNEHLRLSKRFLKFDVLALQNIISSASGHSISELESFTKLSEGGYNRVFEATFSDGKCVLARLPYPSTVPEHYTVASEAATMNYLRLHGFRIPEKLDGTPLGDRWFSMTPKEQYKIMTQIVEWETRLMLLKFPTSESLYYSKDLPSEKRAKLDDPNSMAFCIGPIAHYSWWHGERGIMDIDRGPWPLSVDIFRAVGERELTWAKAYAKPRLPDERLYREIYKFKRVSPDTHVTDLVNYLKIVPSLGYCNPSLDRPVMHHPDLQPNNILVFETNEITGLIDWQHCAILPLGIVAGIPAHFQNYGDPESEMLKQPQLHLPSDYDSMTSSEQNSVKEIHRRRVIHFLYAALTKRLNQDHYDAIFDQSVILRLRLLQSAGSPWEGDSISLRAELIRSIMNWSAIIKSTHVAPPVDYPEDVVRETIDLDAQQREADVAMEQMRHALVVDIMGWVPNEDYEAARRLASGIKGKMLEAAKTPDEVIAIRIHFPFDDFHEGA